MGLKLRTALGAVLFLTGLFAAGCSPEEAIIDSDARILATVNERPITVTWFEQTYVNFLIQTGGTDSEENRRVHLENMIDAVLLSEEFEERGMESTPEYEQFKQRQQKSILAERFFDETFLLTLETPTEADIRKAFVLSKEQMVVRHLFFYSEAEARASWERLESGVSFLEEAQRVYQTASFDSSAGYLGAVKYYSVDDAFGEAAFDLDIGQYSVPIRSRFGFHIILAENRITEALITEDEYQTKKTGISSQYRLRKRRLEGDRFVRGFMESKNVQVNPEAIGALQSLLKDFANDVNPRTTIVTRPEQNFNIDSLRYNMAPETVLATFEWEGATNSFTAGEYVFWLEKLPFQEALNRTAASVGRAMRNELLARAGEEAGFDDAKAKAFLDRDLLQERSLLMRSWLRENPEADVDEELIKKAFESAGMGDQKQFRVDVEWVIFKTRPEAERVATLVSRDPAQLARFDGYRKEINASMYDIPRLAPHLRNAQLDTYTVVGMGDDWAVVHLTRRVREEINWEDQRDVIVNQLAPFASEFKVLERLRESAQIEINELLFRQIAVY